MLQKLVNNKIIILLITLLVIYSSGHALQTIMPQPYTNIALAIFFFTPVLWTILKKQWKTNIIAFMLLVFMVAFQIVFNSGANAISYISQICIIIVAFGISLIYKFDKVVDYYLKIMTVVTVVSLIGYVLVNNNILNLPTMININDVEYGVGIIFNYIKTIPERNCGMFWEPGLFATYLIIAIVFEIAFNPKKTNTIRLIIFVLGVITANSSAGFVLLFLCLILALVNTKNNKMSVFRALFSVVIVVVGVIVFVNLDYIIKNTPLKDNEYFVKLLSSNVEDSSRFNAVLHNLQIFIEHPFGAGLNYVYIHMDHVADTSTSTYILSIYGFLGLLYTIYWIYGVLKQKNINIIAKIVMLIIFILIVNKEPHLSILFTWCILFFMLKNNTEESKIEEKTEKVLLK